MARQLTGPERGLLKEALLDAFDVDDFKQVFVERLERDLGRVTALKIAPIQVYFNVIDAASRQGWVNELIAKAVEANPGNPKLAEFAAGIGLGPVDPSRLELVIQKSAHFLPAGKFISLLSELIGRVCRVEVPTEQNTTMFGTGFLIGPGAVITNYHVVEAVAMGEQGKTTKEGKSARAAAVRCRFDYKELERDVLNDGTVCELASKWAVDLSPYDPETPENLDYAVLRLKHKIADQPIAAASGEFGQKRGSIKLPSAEYPFPEQTPLFILQHPQTMPLKLAMEMKSIVKHDQWRTPLRVKHLTNTDGGSSGSPCFTQDLDPVALHQSGDPGFPPFDDTNEAIPLAAIRKQLELRGFGGELT